jgi:hypothetical protein
MAKMPSRQCKLFSLEYRLAGNNSQMILAGILPSGQ